MGKDNIELIDYLRVIWKQKWLIIVVPLVCIVVSVVRNPRLPEICRAEAVISLGKTLNPSTFSSLTTIDDPNNLAKSIPIEYGLSGDKETSEYSINAEAVKDLPMVKIIMEGPDRKRSGDILKGVVDKLIDDLCRKAEDSIQPYSVFTRKVEADIKMILKDIAQLEAKLKKLDIGKDDHVIVLGLQENLGQRRVDLISVHRSLLVYRLMASLIRENKTKLIGEVIAKKVSVKSNMKLKIAKAGIVGLLISLIVSFFIEYLKKEMKRKKGDLV